ncbi:MAG: hypothetical protein ACUZ8H_14075 [Candidatus Anammoxibacter sp.]
MPVTQNPEWAREQLQQWIEAREAYLKRLGMPTADCKTPRLMKDEMKERERERERK